MSIRYRRLGHTSDNLELLFWILFALRRHVEAVGRVFHRRLCDRDATLVQRESAEGRVADGPHIGLQPGRRGWGCRATTAVTDQPNSVFDFRGGTQLCGGAAIS